MARNLTRGAAVAASVAGLMLAVLPSASAGVNDADWMADTLPRTQGTLTWVNTAGQTMTGGCSTAFTTVRRSEDLPATVVYGTPAISAQTEFGTFAETLSRDAENRPATVTLTGDVSASAHASVAATVTTDACPMNQNNPKTATRAGEGTAPASSLTRSVTVAVDLKPLSEFDSGLTHPGYPERPLAEQRVAQAAYVAPPGSVTPNQPALAGYPVQPTAQDVMPTAAEWKPVIKAADTKKAEKILDRALDGSPAALAGQVEKAQDKCDTKKAAKKVGREADEAIAAALGRAMDAWNTARAAVDAQNANARAAAQTDYQNRLAAAQTDYQNRLAAAEQARAAAQATYDEQARQQQATLDAAWEAEKTRIDEQFAAEVMAAIGDQVRAADKQALAAARTRAGEQVEANRAAWGEEAAAVSRQSAVEQAKSNAYSAAHAAAAAASFNTERWVAPATTGVIDIHNAPADQPGLGTDYERTWEYDYGVDMASRAQVAQALGQAINDYRAANGVARIPVLGMVNDLMHVTSYWSMKNYLRTGALAHHGGQGNPFEVNALFGEAPVNQCHGVQDSENLALRHGSLGGNVPLENLDAVVASVMEGWKNSPGHNTNMLRPSLLGMGISVQVAYGVDGEWHTIVAFGGVACG